MLFESKQARCNEPKHQFYTGFVNFIVYEVVKIGKSAYFIPCVAVFKCSMNKFLNKGEKNQMIDLT